MANAGDEAKAIAGRYKGKAWHVSEEGAERFQCSEPVAIRFYANPKRLIAHLVESYSDYLQELEFVSDEEKWTNKKIVPLAAVNATADSDGDEFMEEATGFLLYDGENKTFLYANTDEWTLDNRLESLDDLGLHERDGDGDDADDAADDD
jgi:hypothetical protein